MPFITIEGIEGAGKSTLRAGLAEALSDSGVELVLTREPGATALGKTLRALVLGKDYGDLTPQTELLLFAADRAQHVAEVIRPALARNALVICDRYIHSTLAYQGYGRGIALDELQRLNRTATNGLVPDLVILLDLPVEAGLERAHLRQNQLASTRATTSWNRFEDQPTDFHRRVRQGFLDLAKSESIPFLLLDATKETSSLVSAACAKIRPLIAQV